jgi:hypothetical protein
VIQQWGLDREGVLDLPEHAFASVAADKALYKQRVLEWVSPALRLPATWDELDAMSREARRPGRRRVLMTIADESQRPGFPVVRPIDIRRARGEIPFTVYHFLVVGTVEDIRLAPPGAFGATGASVVGIAQLDDSPLADAAWRGIQRGLLPAVSGTFAEDADDSTRYVLLEVGLAVEGACPGARVLEAYTA